ncbi:MAG: hypothetical protein K2J37_07780 [Ruminococcus sp.]|nr:hypothetical protein [Ruminococcus sp.]
MDDLMNKISDILSDEDSMRQLNELAQMLNNSEGNDTGKNPETPEKSDNMPDIEMMMKIAELAGSMNTCDKNTELLLALRPHLSIEKQRKLDKAVKMLKLVSVYEAAKESGMLNNII